MKYIQNIHPDLLYASKMLYEPNNIHLSQVVPEQESIEYAACRFTINSYTILFRVAKITPKKIGQFVTFWKRDSSGVIAPFDVTDQLDFLVVSVRNDNQLGQFIFPKTVLCTYGIVSRNGVGGKRALRVYPPWEKPTAQQARKSQQWQCNYFFEIKPNDPANDELQKLFL